MLEALRKVTRQGGPVGPAVPIGPVGSEGPEGLAGPAAPDYKYVLNELIPASRRRDVTGLLGKLIAEDSKNFARALKLIESHNAVVVQMQEDEATLLKEFEGLQDDPKWNFVFEGLKT